MIRLKLYLQKRIKIIKLLNRIAKSKPVPKQIRYKEQDLVYDELTQEYKFTQDMSACLCVENKCLNDYVDVVQ